MILDFLKLRESVESLGKQLVSGRAQIEETKQQIETIVYAPSHPDDIVQAAQKWLEKKQANFESYFEQRIFRQFTSKPGRFEHDKTFYNDWHYTSLIADRKNPAWRAWPEKCRAWPGPGSPAEEAGEAGRRGKETG